MINFMQPTPHQYRAIHIHERNLAVVAGAGSGKTRVLVERYLELLRANPTWTLDSLVAITFTSKAAQEMRDRVRKELERAVMEAGEGDKTRWENLLAAMESARIDTIHALCATILRANAAEAQIDPRFEVLDEIDAGILLDQAIDSALKTLVEADDKALVLFAEYGAATVRDVVASLIGATLRDLPDDVFAHWQAEWQREAGKAIEMLVASGALYGDWHQAAPTGDKLTDVWLSARVEVETLINSRDLTACITALQRLVSEVKLNVGSAGAWGGKDVLDGVKALLKTVREAAKTCLEQVGDAPNTLDRRAAELLPHWLKLLRAVQRRYAEMKAEKALLDFDDLERRAHDLLVNNARVRARYQGAEFKHVLVDEFQDTNRAQWEIVQALADPARSGALFIVGDAKQSIYSFRGADVTVFEEAQDAIGGAGGERIPLTDSFRTHQPLVSAFNHIFSRLLQRGANRFETAFDEPMEAARKTPPNPQPSLELLLIDGKLIDENEDNRSERARQWEAREIALRLRQMVESGTLIYDKAEHEVRPMDYGDVALLFQSTSTITLYEDVFKAYGLPFVTIAGRGYYDRQEVWDVLHLLTVLHNPADDLALAAVLRSPMFGVSDEGLFALRLIKAPGSYNPIPLWQALDAATRGEVYIPPDDIEPIGFARSCLYILHGVAGRVTIAELLRDALARTGYLAVLTGLPDGARRRGNVEKLVDKAQHSGEITLGAFSQYLRDLSAREAREGEAALEGSGAVTLMTVHSSKGLEFPVVVLPDCSWSRGNDAGGVLVYDDELGIGAKVYDAGERKHMPTYLHRRITRLDTAKRDAERKRLLYVAMTRAQDRLILTGNRSARHSKNTWLGWILETLELDQFTQEDFICDYEWGQMRVICPPLPDDLDVSGEIPTLWDALPLDGQPYKPPLLRAVRFSKDAPVRYLSATQIANMGDANDQVARERFRSAVLHASPPAIVQVSEKLPRVSGRQLGDIVHQVLRWQRLPIPTAQLNDLLRNYAWEQGIIDEDDITYAVRTAGNWLNQIVRSPIYQRILNAKQLYRELPFVFSSAGRTIYGVIDVLLQDAQGWALVDYKTSFVEGYQKGVEQSSGNRGLLESHARRYYLQMGVYAAAVREQIGIAPSVYIHYLRYQQTVDIPASAYQAALTELEDRIGSFMGDDDD
jgi:ATP-dependent helicase/nuclease subunit A